MDSENYAIRQTTHSVATLAWPVKKNVRLQMFKNVHKPKKMHKGKSSHFMNDEVPRRPLV